MFLGPDVAEMCGMCMNCVFLHMLRQFFVLAQISWISVCAASVKDVIADVTPLQFANFLLPWFVRFPQYQWHEPWKQPPQKKKTLNFLQP